MPNLFLKEELYRIPIPLTNTWPFVHASWLNFAPLFMMGSSAGFATMMDKDKLEFCNAQLRFHMNSARWHGRWRNHLHSNDDAKLFGCLVLPIPPIAVPELSLVTSGTFISRTLYGEFVRRWDGIHTFLTMAFLFVCSVTLFLAVTEDAPIFVGWRTLDIPYCDVDRIQLSTRTKGFSMESLPFLGSTQGRSSLFRLTVIYTRYVRGVIVFKRRHSESIPYIEFLDSIGRFDSLKFEKWIRRVILNAMTVPYGSVWNLWHFTLS